MLTEGTLTVREPPFGLVTEQTIPVRFQPVGVLSATW
jgi:hypothetical protein